MCAWCRSRQAEGVVGADARQAGYLGVRLPSHNRNSKGTLGPEDYVELEVVDELWLSA